MNENTVKHGPIHFYPTAERDAYISNVVEYAVQIGERQPITASQAAWLVVDGKVRVDNVVLTKLTTKLEHGTWEVRIRERNHHVVVHPAVRE